MAPRDDRDSPYKEMLDQELALLLAFFLPDAHADLDWARDVDSLEQELRHIVPQADEGKRIADKLIRAYRRHSGDPRYFHIEAQGQPDADFPRRMHVYNYRADERFGQHVVSVVFFCDDDPSWKPTCYVATQYGCTRTLEWVAVKLLDWRGREAELERHPNPIALFVLADLESRRTRGDAEERARVKLRLISLLHERKMEAEAVLHWYRYFDWFLPLPEELEARLWQEVRRQEEGSKMPFVTFAERYGRQQGLRAGLEVALELKYGAEGAAFLAGLPALTNAETLEALLQAIKAGASLDDLRKLLPANGPPGNGQSGS
jgi:hypothetical protein